MTVEELKAAKQQLEEDLRAALAKFHKETKCSIDSVDVQRLQRFGVIEDDYIVRIDVHV
jgi:hypothetical protein